MTSILTPDPASPMTSLRIEDLPELKPDSKPNSTSEWLQAYQPISFPRGGHLQTLVGNFWLRPDFTLHSEAEPVVVDESDGSRVLCHGHWQPEVVRSQRLTILLLHGLEGSSDSRYMQGITSLAWQAGCNVIRMNMRNCGGTVDWTPTLYHSGLSADVGSVLRHFAAKYQLRRVAMAGYSMGGNLVLKLAGEWGNQAPAWLRGVVAVSPAADLAETADALHEPANRVYERHFLRGLMRRFRHKAALFPQRYSPDDVGPIRSVREFDEKITARYSGFTGADDYYYRSAAARVLSAIAMPTLVLHAQDDPFIRLRTETRQTMQSSSAIELVETAHGGHCAFLASRAKAIGDPGPERGLYHRHWAEVTLVRYLMATVGHAGGS